MSNVSMRGDSDRSGRFNRLRDILTTGHPSRVRRQLSAFLNKSVNFALKTQLMDRLRDGNLKPFLKSLVNHSHSTGDPYSQSILDLKTIIQPVFKKTFDTKVEQYFSVIQEVLLSSNPTDPFPTQAAAQILDSARVAPPHLPTIESRESSPSPSTEGISSAAPVTAAVTAAPADAPSEDWKCPITKYPIVHPVVLADGISYELSPIIRYLTTSNRSPVKGNKLGHNSYSPNTSMKRQILEFIDRNPGTEFAKEWKEQAKTLYQTDDEKSHKSVVLPLSSTSPNTPSRGATGSSSNAAQTRSTAAQQAQEAEYLQQEALEDVQLEEALRRSRLELDERSAREDIEMAAAITASLTLTKTSIRANWLNSFKEYNSADNGIHLDLDDIMADLEQVKALSEDVKALSEDVARLERSPLLMETILALGDKSESLADLQELLTNMTIAQMKSLREQMRNDDNGGFFEAMEKETIRNLRTEAKARTEAAFFIANTRLATALSLGTSDDSAQQLVDQLTQLEQTAKERNERAEAANTAAIADQDEY